MGWLCAETKYQYSLGDSHDDDDDKNCDGDCWCGDVSNNVVYNNDDDGGTVMMIVVMIVTMILIIMTFLCLWR